jgi:nitrate reductase assembly molybdenum cofactor insertion protein NarJ
MSTTGARVEPCAHDLLRDAAHWRLLGLLFEPPGGAWRRDLSLLAREVDDAALGAAAEAALASATEGLYYSVFGPGGPAPPREVSYHESLELGSLMSELAGYYTAFGYRPADSEAPDHVAVEVGFVAYLRLKEAYAAAAGDAEQAGAARQAAERFRTDHLAMFAAVLAARLTESEIDYLVQASKLLVASAGDQPQRARLPVLHEPIDDGSEFPCCDS